MDNVAGSEQRSDQDGGQRWVTVGDVGQAKDANQIQYNIVRVDGQKSAYIPIMKQGGDTNTIQVVNGVRELIANLFDIPEAAEDRVSSSISRSL